MPDPYLDSATGVLRNRLGITDADTLARAEAWFAFRAEVEMYVSGATIDRCDLAALQAVHRRLFGDVYDWAGELRTVDIAKGASTFALARHLRHAAADVFRQVERIDLLRGLDARRFAAAAGHLLADLNALHPFREGNGRAQRALLQLLARDAGYQLRWGDVEPTENIDVSAAAMSDPDAFTPLLPAGRDADRDGAPGDRARTSCDGPPTVRPGRWQVHLLVHLHGCVASSGLVPVLGSGLWDRAPGCESSERASGRDRRSSLARRRHSSRSVRWRCICGPACWAATGSARWRATAAAHSQPSRHAACWHLAPRQPCRCAPTNRASA